VHHDSLILLQHISFKFLLSFFYSHAKLNLTLLENHTPKFCVSWVSSNNAIFISQTFEDSVKDMNTETNSDVEESSSQV
jgi:hypothetical protein